MSARQFSSDAEAMQSSHHAPNISNVLVPKAKRLPAGYGNGNLPPRLSSRLYISILVRF